MDVSDVPPILPRHQCVLRMSRRTVHATVHSRYDETVSQPKEEKEYAQETSDPYGPELCVRSVGWDRFGRHCPARRATA